MAHFLKNQRATLGFRFQYRLPDRCEESFDAVSLDRYVIEERVLEGDANFNSQ